MKVRFNKVSMFIVFSMLCIVSIYGQYPPNTTYTTIAPPAGATAPDYLSTYDDNTTSTRMKRITEEGTPTHSYPKRQPWNIDGTKYKFRSIAVYDAETHAFYKTLGGLDIYESVWSNTEPNIVYGFTVEGKIRRYNIETEVLDLLYDLNGNSDIYESVKLGPGEGNIDIHDRYVALIAKVKNSTDVKIIVFDLQTPQIVGEPKIFEGMWLDDDWQHQYIDWVSVSQSGDYVGIMWNHNFATEDDPYVDQNGASHYGVEMYNTTNLNYLRRIASYGNHGDFGFAPDGSEVFVQFYGYVAGEQGSVFSYHLDGSGVDIILTDEIFDTHGSHLSCRNILRPGWAYLNTDNSDNGHGRMLAVKLDGSETIENFGHSFEVSGVGFYAYATQVPNPTGTKLMFKSNFGDNSSSDKICAYEAYSIDREPGIVGQWDFNDSGDLTKATVGTDLTSFGSPTSVIGPTDGNGAALLENGDYFSAVTTTIINSGSGTKINTYTLLMDIKIDAFSGSFASLIQTDINNSNDGDLFARSNGKMGNGGMGYSDDIFSTGTWYRMVLVVEEISDVPNDSVTVDIYLNGSLAYNGKEQAVDNRLSLEENVLLFCDDGNEEQPTAVSQIALYDYALTDAEISALGDATNEGLPVELTLFTATVADDAVVLNWETETEVNNYGFNIESSNDKSSWSKIGFVTGYGNSNTSNSYSFTAVDVAKYYRLKQVDVDGGFEYSEVVEVAVNLTYKLSQNYPNPFNPTTKINFTLATDGMTKLSVYNILGKEVKVLLNEQMQAGAYSASFNGSNLTSGVYFYKLESNNQIQVRKMLLVK